MLPPKPSFKEAFFFWLKLGFISFGGPAGQIAIMHEFLVEKKKWISESKFLHALNYCMLLPGPEAQQMSIYSGWLLHGVKGGLTAGILFILPSIFILLGLSIFYVSFGDLPIVYALFNGLKPAVLAIILLSMVKIGKKALLTPVHYVVAFLSFISISFLSIPFPLIIVSAIVIAFAIQQYAPSLIEIRSDGVKAVDESDYYIHSGSVIPHASYSKVRIAKQVLVAVILWLVPFVLFYFFTANPFFWNTLSFFFTKAALVTFGGAYAVLPYVAQVSVEKFHWLSNLQMLDGLALGETTPGPLIMVLAFVGFMAGYNRFSSIVAGTVGLFTTVWFTFLPCFLFVLVGAPIIEKTQNNLKLRSILSVISSAVVGVILSLFIYLLIATVFESGFSFKPRDLYNVLWILVSLFALSKFKINLVLWIGISALSGLGFYWIFA